MFDFEAEVDRSISLLQKKAQSVPVRSGTVVRLVGLRMEARGLMAYWCLRCCGRNQRSPD